MVCTCYFLVQSFHDNSDVPLCEILARIQNLVHVAVINIGNDIVTRFQHDIIQVILFEIVFKDFVKEVFISILHHFDK